mmetsp:Transcript_27198/g.108904  ORF Transcript_27198/g.108904 Transcript_27198/m.108904 type:complete len:206 (+) Transcript_27198:2469-3086(+)
MTTSGLAATICAHRFSMYSSSILNNLFQSSSFSIWTLAFDSPRLYSSGQSRSRMRGLTTRRRMRGCVTSLLNATPRKTRDSDGSPPGIFSTLAYRLTSTSLTTEDVSGCGGASPPGALVSIVVVVVVVSGGGAAAVAAAAAAAWTSRATRSVASMAMSMTRSPNRDENFVPRHECTRFFMLRESARSTGRAMRSHSASIASKATA